MFPSQIAPSPCAFVFVRRPWLLAQQSTPASPRLTDAPSRDTSYIDANGTAHVTRVVPVPQTVSPEAQKSISRAEPDQGPPQPLEARRKGTDAYTARARVEWTKLCPNTIVEDKIAGVPVRIVTPEGMPDKNKDKVLLNLHGGGFNSDSGSYTESIPIASYTGIKVVAVLYRLSPECHFPAAVDDSIAVYKELLKTYKPDHIVIYGTSAGAILTAEVAAKIKQLGLPCRPPSAFSAAWATLRVPAIRMRCMRYADLSAISTRRSRARTIRSTSPKPIPKTRSFRPSTATCTAFRRRSLSPAAATCC